MRTVQLADGTTMPSIAWGNMGTPEKAQRGGAAALRAGLRHIDSAQIYRTEAEVPLAIKDAGVSRDEVYVTTKLFNMPDEPKLHSLEQLKESVAGSLAKLGFIPNLLLVHNPLIPEDGHLGEFWGWLEGLVEDGTLKGCSLGVSNFRPKDLEQVLRVAKIKPVVNQIEYHPYVAIHLQPLLALHAQHNIITQAYASLVPTTRHTGGPLDPILERIASTISSGSNVQVDASGVLLLWVMAKGGVCITSSSDEGRIRKMAALDSVRDLTEVEVKEIDEAGGKIHFRQWTEHLTTDFPSPDLPERL